MNFFHLSNEQARCKIGSAFKLEDFTILCPIPLMALPSTQEHCLLCPLPCSHTIWEHERWLFHLFPSVFISEHLESKNLALFLYLLTTLSNRDYVCNQWLLKRQSIKLCTSTRCYFYFFAPNSHGLPLPRPFIDSVGNSRTENSTLAKPVLLFFSFKRTYWFYFFKTKNDLSQVPNENSE